MSTIRGVILVLLLTLSLWGQECNAVNGYFDLEFVSLANPLSQLADGQCCGSVAPAPRTGRCPLTCNTTLHVCLKEFQPTPRTTGRCTFGQHDSGVIGPSSFSSQDMYKVIIPFNFTWNVSTLTFYFLAIFSHVMLFLQVFLST